LVLPFHVAAPAVGGAASTAAQTATRAKMRMVA
jgi:hypothetical protein